MDELSLYDAHCHLGWFENPVSVARAATRMGAGMLAVTVTPEEFLACRDLLSGEKNVALAAGLHPWWVRDARDADALCDLVPELGLVGEVGLDAAPRRAGTWDAQLAAFERICAACSEAARSGGDKVLSIHAVRACGPALDVLERTGAASHCRCVLHWFSGTPDELWRAVRLGCLFSIGERSIATRRGREYARVLPSDRILTETDLPESEGSTDTAERVAASLERALLGIAAARREEAGAVRGAVARNARALLGR